MQTSMHQQIMNFFCPENVLDSKKKRRQKWGAAIRIHRMQNLATVQRKQATGSDYSCHGGGTKMHVPMHEM